MLRHGISHGYGVYHDITTWRADTWTNVKPGSIYHAIEKLDKQGYIEVADSRNFVKKGPSRTEYKVTTKGYAEFKTLMESSLTSADIQLFAVGIAFMEMLPRQTVVALLQERCSSLTNTAAFLKTLPTENIPSDPSKHPELIGVWVRYVENELENTQRLIKTIQSGKYAFQGEK
jgi:DNA-binding PadR family transcriptional regulator